MILQGSENKIILIVDMEDQNKEAEFLNLAMSATNDVRLIFNTANGYMLADLPSTLNVTFGLVQNVVASE